MAKRSTGEARRGKARARGDSIAHQELDLGSTLGACNSRLGEIQSLQHVLRFVRSPFPPDLLEGACHVFLTSRLTQAPFFNLSP